MPHRIQLVVPEGEYDRIVSFLEDGLRSRVIRNLLLRACDALEEGEDITLRELLRGDFTLQGKDYANL